MKISKSSKARAASRRDQVMRFVQDIQEDCRWWRYQDTEPVGGFVLNDCSYWERVYPYPVKKERPNPPKKSISRRALKKRLYQRGVPSAKHKELLNLYANKTLMRMVGEPDIFEAHGYAVWKAVTRNVHVMWLVFDEYHCCAKGLSLLYEQARSYRVQICEATQDTKDVPDLENAQAAIVPAAAVDSEKVLADTGRAE